MSADEKSEKSVGSVSAADFDLSGIELDTRYRIIELIGEGAGSKVYKAEHKMLTDHVAIKILKAEKLNDAISRERFKREAQLATRLSHPNIVSIRGYGVSPNDEPFIIMELCTGTTLETMLSSGHAVPPQVLISIGEQLTAALSYAHKNGIIHRDIKPANILILQNSKPHSSTSRARLHIKLLDFGLAKSIFSAVPETGAQAAGIAAARADTTGQVPDSTGSGAATGTGVIVGTPNYMSPEQCLGKKLDERSDIYSLSCVLYECATGRQPFSANTDLAVMDKHLRSQASFEKSDKVPEDIQAIILKGLSKDPDARFQNAAELHDALEKATLESRKTKYNFAIASVAIVLCALLCFALLRSGILKHNTDDGSELGTHKKSKFDHLGTIEQDPEDINLAAHEAKRDRPSMSADYQKSEELFLESRRRARLEKKYFLAAKCLMDLGVMYIESRQFNKAEEPLRKALEEVEKLEASSLRSRTIAGSYLALGDLRSEQGHPREAYALHKKAQDGWPDDEKDRKYAISLHLLDDLIEMGAYDEARKSGEKILEDLGPIVDSTKPLYREKVGTQVMLAELDLLCGDEESANKRMDTLLDVRKHEKNYSYTVDAMIDLARKATYQQKYRLADKILRKALTYIGDRQHDKRRWDRTTKMLDVVETKLASAGSSASSRIGHRLGTQDPKEMHDKAISLRGSGDFRSALELLQQAKIVAQKQQNTREAARITGEIANTYFKVRFSDKVDEDLIREANYDRIETILLDTIKQRRAISFFHNIDKIYCQLAQVYSRTNQMDKAVEYYKLAADRALKEDDINSYIVSQSELANIMHGSKDIQQSLKYAEELDKKIADYDGDLVWRIERNDFILVSIYLDKNEMKKAAQQTDKLIGRLNELSPETFAAPDLANLAEHAYNKKQYSICRKLCEAIIAYPKVKQPEGLTHAKDLLERLKSRT